MKVGDKVKVIRNEDKELIGLKGIIVCVDDLNPPIGVDFVFNNLSLLHSLQGFLTTNSGFYFHDYELEVIESLEEEVPETLTLLDQFAMSALQGVLSCGLVPDGMSDEKIAKACYDLAKQMMETRKEYL